VTAGRLGRSASIAAASALVFCLVYALLELGGSGPLDRVGDWLFALPTDHQGRALAEDMLVWGRMVLGALALAAACVLAIRKMWRTVLSALVGLLACEVVCHVAKDAIQRARPAMALVHAGGFSFPSTSSAMAVSAVFVARRIGATSTTTARRRLFAAAGYALAMGAGAGFIAMRVHYATDVLAGWAVGVGIFAVCGVIGEA
jgi:membrane-associated phospholipid phosphatase